MRDISGEAEERASRSEDRAPGGTASAEPDARAEDNSAVAAVIPSWRGSGALDALESFMESAETVLPTVSTQVGMTLSEMQALRHLQRGALGPAELGRHLGVSSAAATGIVDRLEARGHVERRPHPRDRRRTELVITDAARRELVHRLRPMFEQLAVLDEGFSAQEKAVVERYLAGAIEAIGRLREDRSARR